MKLTILVTAMPWSQNATIPVLLLKMMVTIFWLMVVVAILL